MTIKSPFSIHDNPLLIRESKSVSRRFLNVSIILDIDFFVNCSFCSINFISLSNIYIKLSKGNILGCVFFIESDNFNISEPKILLSQINSSIDFKWGFENCLNPPEIQSLGKISEVNNIPLEFQFSQSTNQAFYFIEDVVIDGEPIEIDDWLIAYQGDEVVGARQWTGGITDIPAMGNDGSENSINYLQNGSIPQFKLLKEGRLIDLVGDIPAWSNNGVFMLSELKSATALPESFSVNDAYPNPFNPTTTLKFSLPIEMEVYIAIYNLNGREVVTLQDGNMDAGYHSVLWNADSHSSGVYFIKMIASEFVNTQKLILMK